MAKKIYNKNAREAHLMAEAYQRVHNESAESIEDRFASAVEYAGDVGEFNVQDFLEFKPYIANWDTLLEIIDEENTEGFSERWEEIKFGRSEDAEGDWAENTPAGREDGNEPNNRNKGDTPWYDVKDAEDAEDTFKVGDWVYDSDGSHASIVSIDGDEVALYDGKEGWTTHISEIKPEEYDEGLYPKSLGSGGSITSSQKFL